MSDPTRPQALTMLEPGKIHQLPVKIIYSLLHPSNPSSSSSSTSHSTVPTETFLAYPPFLQPVFIHLPIRKRARSRTVTNTRVKSGYGVAIGGNGVEEREEEEVKVGSLYLKGIAESIQFASPDLFLPSPSSLHSSPYNTPSTCSSSHGHLLPPADYIVQVCSPSPSVTTSHSRTHSSVTTITAAGGADESTWNGSGLLSWALEEGGTRRTMIKGRIIRDIRFGSGSGSSDAARREDEQNGGLEALAREDETDEENEGWGIEVVLRLKRIIDPPSHPRPRAQSTRARSTTPMATSSTLLLSTPAGRVHSSRSGAGQTSSPLMMTLQTPVDVERLKVEVFGERERDGRKRRSIGEEVGSGSLKRRKVVGSGEVFAYFATADKDVDMVQLSPEVMSLTTRENGGKRRDVQTAQADDTPRIEAAALPASKDQTSVDQETTIVLNGPEQDMISGQTTTTHSSKQPSTEPLPLQLPQPAETATKKKGAAKIEGTTKSKRGRKKIPPRPGIFCSNCGRTETCTWRQKEDQRVCNACGIYWNVHKCMRPPEFWGNHSKSKEKTGNKENVARGASPPAPVVITQPVNAAAGPSVTTEQRTKETISKKALDPKAEELAAIRRRRAEAFKRTLSTYVEKEAARLRAKKAADGASKVVGGQAGKTSTTSQPTSGRSTPQSNIHPTQNPAASVTAPTSTPSMPSDAARQSVLDALASRWLDAQTIQMPDLSINNDGLDLELFQDALNQLTANGQGDAMIAGDEDVDISAFFKFSQSQESNASQGTQRNSQEGGGGANADEDDPLSFFHALLPKDNPPSSLPDDSPFDFSQLPPSSPPIVMHDLQHSALLLSSPGTSPNGVSPWSDAAVTPESGMGKHMRRASEVTARSGRHPLAAVAALGATASGELEEPNEATLMALLAEYEA